MAKKKKAQDGPNTTSYKDEQGNRVDVIVHAECKGHGCPRCDGLGFIRQGNLDLPNAEP